MEMVILSAMRKVKMGGGSGEKAEPPNIPIAYLSSWTNNFSPDRKLGEGAFGEVFQGPYQ